MGPSGAAQSQKSQCLALKPKRETQYREKHFYQLSHRGKDASLREFPGGPWLGLQSFTAEGPGSVPGVGTRILQAACCGKKKKKVIETS